MRTLGREAVTYYQERMAELVALGKNTAAAIQALEGDKELKVEAISQRRRALADDASTQARQIVADADNFLAPLAARANVQANEQLQRVQGIDSAALTATTAVLAPLIAAASTNPLTVVKAWKERWYNQAERIVIERALDAAVSAGIQQEDRLQADAGRPIHADRFPFAYLKAKEEMMQQRPPAEQGAVLDLDAARDLSDFTPAAVYALKRTADGYIAAAWRQTTSLAAGITQQFSPVAPFVAAYQPGGKYGSAAA